ncbi:MAG: hypothetical protein CYPHOPRED_006040 [Cyphobasidiales sp. Tagirdzhanova-0007]|nr:MAG: hypothetical protein CYPHOPRED_006040 [Cyphobasidiales sp. Tagirdzhanova-0007]
MSNQPDRINSGGSDPETKTTLSGAPDKRFKEHGGGQHGNQGGRQTGFDEDGDGTSRMRTETDPNEETAYKPNLHGGVKKDGGQDSRVSSEHGFGGDRERASEAGKKGGSASYENGGLDS